MSKEAKAWRQAIIRGNTTAIAKFIKNGIDVNEPLAESNDDEGTPPIVLAAIVNGLEAARLLLEAGADVNQTIQLPKNPKEDFSYSHDSALILGAGRENLELVQLLVEAGADLSFCSSIRDSPLYHAISEAETKRTLPIVCYLLDQGLDPLKTPTGRNLLSCAAWNKKARGAITELIARGADPNVVDKRTNATPIYRAIKEGNARAVEELLAGGADPQQKWPKSKSSHSEMTPLEYATTTKKKKIIELLEAASAATSSSKAKPQAAKKKPVKLPTMAASWKRLEKHLAESHAHVFESLNKGANQTQLRKLSKTDIRVTKEVKDLFSQHNGQSDDATLISLPSDDEEFRLLTTDECLREWQVWQELQEGGDFEDLTANADDGVREVWWHPKWLPIATNGGGDFLCVDFSPAKGGKQGQVITLWHDNADRCVLFLSVREMLADITEHWCNQ